MKAQIAKSIATGIEQCLRNREGFYQLWNSTPQETQSEIRNEFELIALAAIESATRADPRLNELLP